MRRIFQKYYNKDDGIVIKKVDDLDNGTEDNGTEGNGTEGNGTEGNGTKGGENKELEDLKKEIQSLKEKINKYEANEKELLKCNNELFAKCLALKENKSVEKTEEYYKKFL